MDKLGSKPLNQLTDAELRSELQWTRNELAKARQTIRDQAGWIRQGIEVGDEPYVKKARPITTAPRTLPHRSTPLLTFPLPALPDQ